MVLCTMTSIRCLTPNDRPHLEAFLDRHRSSSMILRSNLFHSGLEDGPEPFQGLYMGAFSGDALTDVAAHYWNGNVILQAPTRPVEMALAVARESGRPVNGLLGPWSQVRAAEPELDLDRGHGRAVVAGSLLDARAAGVVEAILFTEAENHPAQRAYEALGFERIGDYGMVMLDPVQVNDEG